MHVESVIILLCFLLSVQYVSLDPIQKGLVPSWHAEKLILKLKLILSVSYTKHDLRESQECMHDTAVFVVAFHNCNTSELPCMW